MGKKRLSEKSGKQAVKRNVIWKGKQAKPSQLGRQKKMIKIPMETLFWTDNPYCNSSSISSLYTSTQDVDNFERFQEMAKIFFQDLKKIDLRLNQMYWFLLKWGLRVKFYPVRIITHEKLLNIAANFLYVDSLE